MKYLVTLGMLAFAALAYPTASEARTYAWCAHYTWHGDNCGFSTLNQCLATVSGVGGFCRPNPRFAYAPPRGYR